jgi:protein CpxP
MKKLITMIVLALGVTFTSQAQKKERKRMEKLSVEQQTELAVKKMTLHLDLTDKQQAQIKPLIAQKMEERKKMHEQRKAFKESGKELTADERFELKSKMLDKQIAQKAEMKRILNEEQFEKYEKMQKRRKHAFKKRGKKGKHFKRKGKKEEIKETN